MKHGSDRINTNDPVLILDGCGFLGSHIVDDLISEKFVVVVASRNPRRYLNPAARYITLDIHDEDATTRAIDDIKPCAIIQAVSAASMASQNAHRNDYKATKNLLRICYSASFVKVFVYTSTAEAIANSNVLHQITESQSVLHTHSTAPHSHAEYKALSEALTLSYNQPGSAPSQDYAEHLRTLSLRMPGIYGPRDGSITSGLLQGAHTFVSRLQFGTNESMNEWIYVENAARAYTLTTSLLLQDDASSVAGESLFVSDGDAIKFWDFARKIWAAAGDERASRLENRIILPWAPVVALAMVIEVLTMIFTLSYVIPPMSPHHLQYMRFGAWWDIAKARERLRYEPLVTSDPVIVKTVAWFQNKRNGKYYCKNTA